MAAISSGISHYEKVGNTNSVRNEGIPASSSRNRNGDKLHNSGADKVSISRKAAQLQRTYEQEQAALEKAFAVESKALERNYRQDQQELKTRFQREKQALGVNVYA